MIDRSDRSRQDAGSGRNGNGRSAEGSPHEGLGRVWRGIPLTVKQYHALLIIVSGIVLLVDLLVPLGIASGVLYTVVIFGCSWLRHNRAPIVYAGICSVLNLVGFALSPPQADLLYVLSNRVLAMVAIWVMAMLIVLRARAVDELASSEERFRSVVDTAVSGIVTINRRGIIESVNRAACALFGYSVKELLGRNVSMLMPEPFRSNHDGYLARYLRTGEARIIGVGREVTGLRRDGETFPMFLSLGKFEQDGEIFFTGVIQDITMQKQAEERFRLVVESSPNGMVMVDAQGRIVLVNAQTEEIFGYDREEMMGQAIEMLVPERFRGAHPEYRERFMANASSRSMGAGTELFGRRKDGREVPVEVGLTPLRTDEGMFVLSSVVDITERRKSHEALKTLNEELMRSNKELDEFAYIASHDLKEPLRGIHNYSTFLIEDYGESLDEDGQDKLRTLMRLTQRLEGLIDALLQFSRLGRVDLAFRETDLQELVRDVVDSLHITCEERGIEIRVPNELPVVTCDRVRVAELFRNLISNAIKYNDKSEPWIEIGYEMRPVQGKLDGPRDIPVFHVRDNGIGIQEKYKDTVFRIFKRLHGRSKFGGGTGVGLTIVKKIVERHGGSIWIESQYGDGTTFFFTLEKGIEHDQREPDRADGSDSAGGGQRGGLPDDAARVQEVASGQ